MTTNLIVRLVVIATLLSMSFGISINAILSSEPTESMLINMLPYSKAELDSPETIEVNETTIDLKQWRRQETMRWHNRTLSDINYRRRYLNDEEIKLLKEAVMLLSAVYCPKTLTVWKCDNYCEYERRDMTVEAVIREPVYTGLAYIGAWQHKRQIFIGFRGTAEWKGVFQSFEYRKVELRDILPNAPPNAKVHRGFMKPYKALEIELKKAFTEIKDKYKDWNVVIAGHSVGGNHAVLFGAVLVTQFGILPSRLRIYSIGQPRAGDAAYANYIDSLNLDIYRIVNNNDIVTRTPPSSWGFCHFGTEIWVTNPLIWKVPNEQKAEIPEPRAFVCSVYKSDPECSTSLSSLKLSASAHKELLGMKLTMVQYCDSKADPTSTSPPTMTASTCVPITTPTFVGNDELLKNQGNNSWCL